MQHHAPDTPSPAEIPATGWPRGLTFKQAAAYLGVTTTTLRYEVRAGIWHAPKKRGKYLVFDRLKLDTEFDSLYGCKSRQNMFDKVMDALTR